MSTKLQRPFRSTGPATVGQLAATLLAGSLFAVGALSSPGSAPFEQERYLKDGDLKKFGSSLTDYFEARTERKKETEAQAKVFEEMEKLTKKLSKTPAEGDLLASPGDLGYGMWLSFDYAKKRKPKSGKVADYEFEGGNYFTKDDPLNYTVWTPEKYRPKTDSYPLIILIPDVDQRPFDLITERWTDADLREGAILAVPEMSEQTAEWEQLDGKARLLLLYKDITNNWAVDFDRIYLAGRGRGVETAHHWGSIYPDRFAGVIGHAGDAGKTSPDNFGNLPTFFAGAGQQATDFKEAASELGYENVTLQADGKVEDIWAWITDHPRNSYPSSITLVGTQDTHRMYWLQVPQTDGRSPVKVSATADRDTNTITVDGYGVTEFTLHFSDAILDLDREVTVIANGTKNVSLIPRSRLVTLNNIYNSSVDPGKVLVAQKLYSLPAVSRESDD